MHVERAALDALARHRWQGDLVVDGQGVIRELELRIVDAPELEEHLHEVRLALREQGSDVLRRTPDLPDPEVLAVEDRLGVDELLVELRERKRGRQDGMLDVEEAVVTRGEPARLGQPRLGPRIRGVHGDVHHLGDLAAPLAHHAEALAVPARIGDDVDRDVDVDRARELERLEVLGEAHPLAELAQAFLVDRLDAEEHDLEAELGPELEDLLVAQDDVAAGLDVVALLDAPACDRLANRHAVLCLDEGDVVEDEEPGLADAGDLLHGALRRLHAIAPAVEGPGAAERAVPGTAPAELDGRARVELADEVLAAVAQ